MHRPAGRAIRVDAAGAAADLKPRARAAVALCIADVGRMNDAVARLQWSRAKGALALYHHSVGTIARRTATAIAGTALRTVDAASERPIGAERAALDERAIARLRICDEASLRAIETAARAARARWRERAARAWRRGRVREAAEWHTGAVYAYHVARWTRMARRHRGRGSAGAR